MRSIPNVFGFSVNVHQFRARNWGHCCCDEFQLTGYMIFHHIGFLEPRKRAAADFRLAGGAQGQCKLQALNSFRHLIGVLMKRGKPTAAMGV